MTNRSEEIRNNKLAVAVYTSGIVCYVVLAVFALINLLRGIPIWSLACAFYVTSAVYTFMTAQIRKRNDASKRYGFSMVMALICFILYFVLK